MTKLGLNSRRTIFASSIAFVVFVLIVHFKYANFALQLASVASTTLMVPVAITYLIDEHRDKKMINLALEVELNKIKASLDSLNEKQENIEAKMNRYFNETKPNDGTD